MGTLNTLSQQCVQHIDVSRNMPAIVSRLLSECWKRLSK